MEKAKRISQGSVGTMYALSSFFINNFTHLHCAARVANLNSLAQLNHHYSLPTSAIRNKTLLMSVIFVSTNQEAVNWTSSSPLERTQCRQESMRGGCSTNWNRCLIDAGKPTSYPQAPPSMCPSIWWFLRYLLPFPKLAHHSSKGRFCTPLKDPEWQWGC